MIFRPVYFRAIAVIATVFIGLGAGNPVTAQDAGGKPQPTIKEILQLIEKNGSFSINAAVADIGIAIARRDAAVAALYPRLTLSATGRVFRSSDEAYGDEHKDVYGDLEVVQPIYDFGKTSSAIEAATKDTAAATDLLISARNTVLIEGMALYFDLHASELEMRSLYEAHSSAYVHWERSKERLTLGQASPLDVAETLTLVEQTRLEYYRERNHNIALRLRLEELTGSFIDEELFSPPKPPLKSPPEMDRIKFAEVVALSNPELTSLIKQADAKGILRDGVGNLPSLEAYGNVGKTSNELRGRKDYAVGARLSWPLFDGGINQSKRSQLAAEESRINAAIGQKRSQLRIRAHEALLEIQNSYQQVVAARAKLDYASRNLLMRQQLYQQDRVADLGRAMIENTGAEAGVVRATGLYFLDLAHISVLLGQHPGKALEDDFLTTLFDNSAEPVEQYIPKTGSGFGQEDQDKTNRKLE